MEILHQKLSLLPEKPGVYLMKDSSDHVIYVGKAKILRNRVRSYFTGSHNGKTELMISQIADIETIITDSEVEALVLECNLIKKHNPKYNILLRDDKSYPYITITEEVHPRIMVTRKVKKGSGRYFGPYPNATAAREASRLLNRLFPFRKCRHIPTKPCLYYHLHQCLGPCIEEIKPQSYNQMRKEVIAFLKGDQHKILEQLEQKMHEAAENLEFEKAKEYRDLISDLRKIGEKQNITLNDFIDRDVIGYALTKDQICIQVFYLRQGKLLSRDNFIFPFYEDPEEAFISFLAQFYTDKASLPQEILVPPIDISILTLLFPIVIPQKGQKHDLVKLAMENAQKTLHDQITLEAHHIEESLQALEGLGKSLNLAAPHLIEAFDISNIAGTHTVAGMVQFLDGKPNRHDYRKFKIQPMENMDDTAAMRQVISRRYARLKEENLSMPDLILLDGGKGQISAALEALQGLELTISVAGMVKNDRHQTAGLLNQKGSSVDIKKDSPTFHLLERIQNEVHRFAITFHRQQRAKTMTLSELDGVPGVGPKRRQALLRHFKSIERIRIASPEELQAAGLPIPIAETVYHHFREVKKE
ncbi:excinuclease ABC subunit UvrC [Desulfitobacterium sp. Sab5]|uniref:excinuclease ABC subunit UvrC n=1 Tax=Desulfitobacterium nosdiversum TaxID=3375356 RepID=UPI003CEBD589